MAENDIIDDGGVIKEAEAEKPLANSCLKKVRLAKTNFE